MENQNHRQATIACIEKQLNVAGWQLASSLEDTLIADEPDSWFAIRQHNSNRPEYLLVIDGEAIGNINANKEQRCSKNLPFVYTATSEKVLFTNNLDHDSKPREVFNFHRPETLVEYLKSGSSLFSRLHELPKLNPFNLKPSELGLRNCQEAAIKKLETSLRKKEPRTLIQMATGSGKTYTAINLIYRLLKHAKAKRVLFLVDTKNLGEQAEQEMLNFMPPDSNSLFYKLHPVHRIKSNYIPSDAQVYICTIQRMYSMLSGSSIDEEAEYHPSCESEAEAIRTSTVIYNPSLPIEFFDFIFIDECHRSIYHLWSQVLDYFDAMLIGLTATPDKRTLAFFDKNLVFKYSHQDAVADGVNVGSEVYLIETQVTQHGGQLKAMQPVQFRNRLTQKKSWQQQDQDEAYSAKQLDVNIVNPSQINTVIETFKSSLPRVFPNRIEVPKTLIFAKNDRHADDIVRAIQKIFNQGSDFCQKITYRANDGIRDQNGHLVSAGEKPETILSRFRQSYNPRIAVTVDMIATGTDIKPLECLMFMRDVKSRNYFEQMKGRGARTLDKQRLRRVTPDATSDKTHFVIYDAIGVTQSLSTPSQPLVTNPSIPLVKLLRSVMMGAYGLNTVSSLAGRLARLDRQIDNQDRKRIEADSGGISLALMVRDLLSAIDTDSIEDLATKLAGLPKGADPGDTNRQKAQQALVSKAAVVFNEPLIKTLVELRREKDQKIDHFSPDHVTYAGWSKQKHLNAQSLRDEFSQYLTDNVDSITALQIYFKEPYRRREVTFDMVKEVLAKLKADRPQLAPTRIWDAYSELDQYQSKRPEAEIQLLISLIRRVSGIDHKLSPITESVNRNFQRWILSHHAGSGEKFNKEQVKWLRMIRDHIASSLHFEVDDFERAPFDAEGSLAKMYDLFGDGMYDLINTLNEELAA